MKKWEILELGSSKSGNWGHAGRPGQRGGSVSRSVAMSIRTGRDWKERQAAKGEFGESPVTGSQGLGKDKGVNDSLILEFADGSKGIFKSEDMNHGSAEGEVLTYELSEALGWDIVPETIEFTHERQRGSLQKWVDDAEMAIDYKRDNVKLEYYRGLIATTNPVIQRDWDRIRALDSFLGNNDRHAGNWLIGKDRLWAIDNGGAFHIGFGGKMAAKGNKYWDDLHDKRLPSSSSARELRAFTKTPEMVIFADRVGVLLGEAYGEKYR